LNFRKLVQPARDKFGAHLDRQAHANGLALGGAGFDLWTRFWLDLQAFVEILSEHFLGARMLICAADGSDAPLLLRAVHAGRLVAHAEEQVRLQGELGKGIRSLDAGKGEPLDIEKFIEEQHARHAES